MPHFSFVSQLFATVAAQPQAAFVWTEHLPKIISIALLSMVPTFEGRYALSAGLAMGMPTVFTFLLAFIMSSIPMPFIFWLFRPIIQWMYRLPFKPIQKFAGWVENKAKRKSAKVTAASLFALFAFVAVPLPGTGVWTGSMIAVLLEMDLKKSAVAILLGNLCACTIMLLLSLGVLHFF